MTESPGNAVEGQGASSKTLELGGQGGGEDAEHLLQPSVRAEKGGWCGFWKSIERGRSKLDALSVCAASSVTSAQHCLSSCLHGCLKLPDTNNLSMEGRFL